VPPFPPLIRRVRAGGELRPLRPGLTDTSGVPALRLPYKDNRLRFEFALPDFSAPSLNRYQILLDGFDEEWSGWTDETRRDYTNLHEGRYRFRVRARNAHGRMSDEAHYDFAIAPPWYRSLWAYAAYVLLLLTTGPSIYLVRVRQLQRRQRELEVLVAERTRELTEGNRRISEQARQLELLARTDPLTQLANRRSMQERLRLEAARVTRGAPSFSLVMADIDEFKIFNDRYGHDCGDFVLASVGETMQKQLREQDLLARWGGEEFLLLLADTSLDGGGRMAERLREAIVQTSFVYRGFSLSVRLSFGVVEFGRDGDAEACVAAADAAMYRAKVAGRDRIVLDQPKDDNPQDTEDLAN
jgi:diguanylate cyclase (GGDEF)-like protein